MLKSIQQFPDQNSAIILATMSLEPNGPVLLDHGFNPPRRSMGRGMVATTKCSGDLGVAVIRQST